jgi:hypothetical protein
MAKPMSTGHNLIARLALEHPDRRPRDVLEEMLKREKTLAALSRALGVNRPTVRAALRGFGLRQGGPCSPEAHTEATRAGLARAKSKSGPLAHTLAALDLLDRVRFRAAADQLPDGAVASAAWDAARQKPLTLGDLESYGLQLSDLPALLRAGVLVPEATRRRFGLTPLRVRDRRRVEDT